MAAAEERVERLVARFRGNYLLLYPDTTLANEIAGEGAQALPVLHRVLEEDEENKQFELRAGDAAFCLGLIGSKDSVQPLIKAARKIEKQIEKQIERQDDPFPNSLAAIMAICEALGQIGSHEAVPFLLELVEKARPQVDYFGRERVEHHTVRRAAAKALEEITGDEYHYEDEPAFAAPPVRSRVRFISSRGQLREWEIEGGQWEETPDGIRGAAEGTGRLWLRKKLPGEYTFNADITINKGTAGFSFGHLKDYVPVIREPDYPGTWFEFSVSNSQVIGLDTLGETSSQTWLWLTWRSCAVGSRADLGDRIALFVSGGSAVFGGIELKEGAPMLD